MDFATISDTIGFRPAFDTLSIAFLFLASFFYGLSVGRKRMMVVLTSTYFSFAVVQVFPFWRTLFSRVGEEQAFFVRSGLFLFFLVVIYMILSGARLRTMLSLPPKGLGSWWQIFVLAVSQVGLLVTIFLSFSPENSNIELTPVTTRLFSHSAARFLWFLAPIIFLGFFRKEKNIHYE